MYKRIILIIWKFILLHLFQIKNSKILSDIGVLFLEIEFYKNAIKYLSKSNDISYDTNLTNYNNYYLGYSYVNLGNHKKASIYFEKYSYFERDDIDVLEMLGWCYLVQNENNKAKDIYSKLIRLNSDNIAYKLQFIKILIDLKNINYALNQLKDMDLSSDKKINIMVSSYLEYRINGNFEESKDALIDIINYAQSGVNNEMHFNLGDLYLELSELYKKSGDHENSLSVLEKYYKINSNDYWINNALAYEYATQNKNLLVALKLSVNCVKFQPENAIFIDTKAWILFKLNKIQESKRLITKCVELDRNSSQIQSHYNQIYSVDYEV